MPLTKLDLDAFDLRLLELLQGDARTPVAELAAAVGLSAPACYRRVRRLRESGVIEREIAVVRPKSLGYGLSMIVLLVLEREGSRTVAELMSKVAKHPQVLEVMNVTGDYDFAVRLVARDMEDYGELADRLFADDERVRSFKTLVVIRESRPFKPLRAAD